MYLQLKTNEVDKIKKYLPDARIRDKGNNNYKIRGASKEQITKVLDHELTKATSSQIDAIRKAFPSVRINEIDTELDLYEIKGITETQIKEVIIPKTIAIPEEHKRITIQKHEKESTTPILVIGSEEKKKLFDDPIKNSRKEPVQNPIIKPVLEEKTVTEQEKKRGGFSFSSMMADAAQELEKDILKIQNDLQQKAKDAEQRMEASARKMEQDAKEKVSNLGKVLDEKVAEQNKKIEDAQKTINESFEKFKGDVNNIKNSLLQSVEQNKKDIATINKKLDGIASVLKP